MANILYISLTGMTEPLGRSQVLEYLIDLSKQNKIYLISFEREKDLKNIDEVKELVKKYNIEWDYFIYSNKYGIFSTISQIIKTIFLGNKLIKQNDIQIIHARSIIPATMGFFLKKLNKVKLIFDIRGFSIDEKVDRGRIKRNSFLFKFLKKWDNYLYKTSDYIVTLTYTSKNILIKKLNINKDKITVIPTCANKEIFKLINENEKKYLRKKLGFEEKDIIIIHTGTVLNRYDFDKELEIFKYLNNRNKNMKFLILNKGEHELIKDKFFSKKIDEKYYLIIESKFTEVYKYLNIADFSMFFIPPTFAKQAMAPTKFAENVACYLPSITNSGVGDMEYYVNRYSVGYIIDWDKLNNNFDDIVNEVYSYMENYKLDIKQYDELFNKYFDKSIAIKKYNEIYQKLFSKEENE